MNSKKKINEAHSKILPRDHRAGHERSESLQEEVLAGSKRPRETN